MSEERRYKVSAVPTAYTYDRQRRRYIPAMNLSSGGEQGITWDELVSFVLKKGFVGEEPSTENDGWAIIPSRMGTCKHMKTGREGVWRYKDNCLVTSILGLDIEEHDLGVGDDPVEIAKWIIRKIPYVRFLVYSSHSHGLPGKWEEGQPRLRVLIPLSRDLDSQNEYPHLIEWAYRRFGEALDPSCKDPSRALYTARRKHPEAILEPWYNDYDAPKAGLLDPDNLPLERDPITFAPIDDGYPTSITEIAAQAEEEERARQKRLEEARERRVKAIQKGTLEEPNKRACRRYALRALEGIASVIRSAPRGSRHHTIIKKSARATAFIGEYLTEHEVRDALLEAAFTVLPSSRHEDAKRAVDDGLAWGKKEVDFFDWSRLAREAFGSRPEGEVDWGGIDFSKYTQTKVDFQSAPVKKSS